MTSAQIKGIIDYKINALADYETSKKEVLMDLLNEICTIEDFEDGKRW